MKSSLLATLLAGAAGSALLAAPATAQTEPDNGKPDYNVLVGAGPRIAPTYPGSGKSEIGAFPAIEVWEAGTPFPAESADEGIGPVIFGKRLGTGAGVTFAIAPMRARDDVPGLDKVGFGVEAGGFVQTFLGQGLRLRGELRQAIGSHKGLVGDLMADAVLRGPDDRFVITAGPRVRWGDAQYHRALFGIDAPAAIASGLPAYRPGGGIHAYGGQANAHLFLGPSLGLNAYGRYDRLVGDAADSPIVKQGSRNQLEGGLALTYRFRIRR